MSPLQQIDLSALLKGIPEGAWVAISHDHDKVLAYGFDIRAVQAEAKSKGEVEPLMTRVPELASALML